MLFLNLAGLAQPSTDGAAPGTKGAAELLAPVVAYALRTGTNRPISSDTAKAFGLGDEAIPATQIILAQKDETLVHFFGVSAQNSNDLFIARIDRNTRTGKVWLANRAGKVRGSLLTSTNGVPQAVPDGLTAKEFAEEVNIFVEFVAPAPWEDSPHPLNAAAKFGEVSDVAKILDRDPKSINTPDEEGMTPLAGAIVQAHVETVRFLLDKGADPSIPNKNGLTPLEHACSRDKSVAMDLVKLLLAKGAAVNPTNRDNFALSPLFWAIATDNIELVKLLIDRGADVKLSSDVGHTCLHDAADRGGMEICEILIAHGADVNARITGGTTPLHNAAWGGYGEVVKLLLSKGADPDPKLTTGVTPLFYAAGPGAERNGKACVEILLAHGANVNVTDEQGATLLHTAAYYGNKDVIEVLLAHGESVNVKDKREHTPLQTALKSNHPAIADILRQHGAKD